MRRGSFYKTIHSGDFKMRKDAFATQGYVSDCGELILHNAFSVKRPVLGEWVISHRRSGGRIIGDITSKKHGLFLLNEFSSRARYLLAEIGENGEIPQAVKPQLKEIRQELISGGGK